MKAADTHCHLDFEQFDDDREEVIERAKNNLAFVVNAGSNLEHNKKSLELEKEHPLLIVANLGLHPTYTDSFSELDEIKEQIRENDPAAIGEIGLDHHHVDDEETQERQEEVFREMLDLAEELDKPVVIHSRDAEQKVVDILDEYDLDKVMLHCFNGSPELAEEAAEKGMKIGITTQVLYKEEVEEIVEVLDIEDMFLETDSPFLAKEDGENNEPVNVFESAEKIGEIKREGKIRILDRTTRNAREFFGR